MQVESITIFLQPLLLSSNESRVGLEAVFKVVARRTAGMSRPVLQQP
jgi:hypothetical protein